MVLSPSLLIVHKEHIVVSHSFLRLWLPIHLARWYIAFSNFPALLEAEILHSLMQFSLMLHYLPQSVHIYTQLTQDTSVQLIVHLSVSSRYQDGEGCEHSESPRCLNSKETEQMYSSYRSIYTKLNVSLLFNLFA